MIIHTVIYIGDSFYDKSDTMMSPIYERIGGDFVSTLELEKTDWGKVRVWLANGEEVKIRPATQREMTWAYKSLAEYLERRDKREHNITEMRINQDG